MLESKVGKVVESTNDEPEEDTSKSDNKCLPNDNNIQLSVKKEQKENYHEGMKMHNFTECCRMWMCTHCSKSFASSRALKIHEVKQHEKTSRRVLKCGTCHEEFEHSNLLHIHMRVHHNMKLRCPRCKDIFEHPNVLKLHLKAHHSEPVCLTCGVTFDHDKLLRLHMEHYHKVGSKGTKADQEEVASNKTSGTLTCKGKFASEINAKLGVINKEKGDILPNEMEDENEQCVYLQREQLSGFALSEKESESCQQCTEGEAISGGSHDADVGGRFTAEGRRNGVIKQGGIPAFETEDNMEYEQERNTNGEDVDNHEDQTVAEKKPLTSPFPTNDGNLKETEMAVSDVRGNTSSSEERKDSPKPSFYYGRDKAQLQRSSVIVTTGSVSAGSLTQSTIKKKSEDLERSALGSVFLDSPPSILDTSDVDASPKGSPQSHPGSISSSLSGEESGDLEPTNRAVRSPKRVSLRCNLCQVQFLSKTEYLHHLISHQNRNHCEKISEESSKEEQSCNAMSNKTGESSSTETEDRVGDFPLQSEGCISVANETGTQSRMDSDTISTRTTHTSNAGDLPDAEEGSHGFGLTCSLCKELFKDFRGHKLHVEKCHMKPHCAECGLRFDHKNLLKIHMSSYHGSKEVLQCYYCNKSFNHRAEFLTHVTSHETKPNGSEEAVNKPNVLRTIRSVTEMEDADRGNRSKRFRSSRTEAAGSMSETSDNTMSRFPREFQVRNSTVVAKRCSEKLSDIISALSYPDNEDDRTQRTSQLGKPGDGGYSDAGGAKTRIFLPGLQVGRQKHTSFVSEASTPSNGRNQDSVLAASHCFAPYYRLSAFSHFERSDNPNEVSDRYIRNNEYKIKPVGRPPPLIPVLHTRAASTITGQGDVPLRNDPLFIRAHQPVTRTCSANAALSSYISTFLPPKSCESTKESEVVSGHENINSVTKEALLHSLSLRRRASAPELGARTRQFDVFSTGSGSNPRRQTLRGPCNSLVSSVVPRIGKARQLNDAYQPRRRHPRDFTCHHCGIYFGHKKLLKIHLDCYHGTSQELQCLPCKKHFSNRSDFLEHLMSHEDKAKVFVNPPKSSHLGAPRVEKLTHEGETVIHRELNRTAIRNSAVSREALHRREPACGGIGDEVKHPSPEDTPTDFIRRQTDLDLHEQETVMDAVPEARGTSAVQSSVERNEDHESANFCFVCGKSFNRGKELEQHLSSHAVIDKDGRYCCSLCQKTFDHHRKLEIHSRSHTGFKPHKCELCGRGFPYYSSYYYHKMTHTVDRPHKCNVCGKGFIQNRYLRAHMKTHKDQIEWTSDEEVNGEMRSDINGEKQLEYDLRKFETKVKTETADPSEFSVQENLEEQATARILCSFKQGNNAESRDAVPQMDVRSGCVEVKASDSALHGTIPLSETSDKLSLSPKSSNSYENAGSAEKGFHGEEVPIAVSQIKRDCITPNSPRTSKDTEEPPTLKKKTYQCKYCHKNFSSYSSLHVHVRIHTGLRPYSCNHCLKKFTHSSGLKRHVRCHTGEKPYSCPACPAAFADRGALKSHIRTHTGERPFMCDLCKKTFTQPSSLRVHKKTVHAHEFFDDK